MVKPVHQTMFELGLVETRVDKLLSNEADARNLFRGMIIVRMAVALEDKDPAWRSSKKAAVAKIQAMKARGLSPNQIAANLKRQGIDVELEAIRELRNAILHNDFDASQNQIDVTLKIPGLAKSIIHKHMTELKNEKRLNSTKTKPLPPYFSMRGGIVRLDEDMVSEPCGQILLDRLGK